MLTELIGKSNREFETYGLSSDFCTVTGKESADGLLTVQLLDRSGTYDGVLHIGFQKPIEGTEGVLLFVGKQKYPVFIPINFNSTKGQASGTTMLTSGIGVSPNLGEPLARRTKFDTWVPFDRTFALFDYKGTDATEQDQQYCSPDIEPKLKNIAKSWYYDSNNSGHKKLILGDIALKGGAKFHREHDSGTVADIFAGSGLNVEDVYSTQQIKTILNIFKNNGVKYVLFQPKNYNDYSEFQTWVSNRVDGHKNHFHVKF